MAYWAEAQVCETWEVGSNPTYLIRIGLFSLVARTTAFQAVEDGSKPSRAIVLHWPNGWALVFQTSHASSILACSLIRGCPCGASPCFAGCTLKNPVCAFVIQRQNVALPTQMSRVRAPPNALPDSVSAHHYLVMVERSSDREGQSCSLA